MIREIRGEIPDSSSEILSFFNARIREFVGGCELAVKDAIYRELSKKNVNQGVKEFCPDFGHFRRRFALFRRRLRDFKRRSKFFKRRSKKFKRRLNFQKPDFRPFERLFCVFECRFSPKTRDLKNVKFNVKIS